MARISDLPNLPGPAAPGDFIPVVRDGVGYKAAPSGIVGGGGASEQRFFGSALFHPDNGFSTDPNFSAQAYLTGFKTAMTGAGAAAFWNTAGSVMVLVDMMAEKDVLYQPQCLWGHDVNSAQAQSLRLTYHPPAAGSAPLQRTFEFALRGDTTGTWTIRSAQIPAAYLGPFAVYAFTDGTNGYLHVYDIPSATWIDGAATAKPGGWAGLPTIFYDPMIGGNGRNVGNAFPVNNSGDGYNTLVQFRGAMADFLFTNVAMAKADVVAMVNGAAVVATAVAAGATKYCHVPLVDGSGALTTTINSHAGSGISALTVQGRLLPGQTMRRQAAATYLTVDRMKWPACIAIAPGATDALHTFTGTYAGVTGDVHYRIVSRDGGVVLKDWTPGNATMSAGVWSLAALIPGTITSFFQVQFRTVNNPATVATTHGYCLVGYAVQGWGQSELHRSFLDTANYTFGPNTTLNAPFTTAECETVVFLTKGNGATAANLYHMRNTAKRTGFLGDAAVGIINTLRRFTAMPFFLIDHAISGTGPIDLMADSQSGRTWTDMLARVDLLQNRGPRGEYPVIGDFIGGWEGNLGGGSDPIKAAFAPWLTGVASGATTTTASIAQADINHWRHDGTWSFGGVTVIKPCDREALVGNRTGVTDNYNEADQRDQFRNYSHRYGYIVGPQDPTHKLENEVGGALVGSPSHPMSNDYEGCYAEAIFNAHCILLAAGMGVYPGPVFFEKIRPGTASNKVIVTLGNPRPHPGAGLVEGAIGYTLPPPDQTTGNVTQITSITTGVNFNVNYGNLTTVSHAIAPGGTADIVVTSNRIRSVNDTIRVRITGGTNTRALTAQVINPTGPVGATSGNFTIRLTNRDGSNATNGTTIMRVEILPANSVRDAAQELPVRGPADIHLFTKKAGGGGAFGAGAGFEASIDGGPWSKLNVTSGAIINGREVELTLAGTYTTVAVRYHPGTPGNYVDTTVINQDDWRSGSLWFAGGPWTAGQTIHNLGFAVSGSNMELVL